MRDRRAELNVTHALSAHDRARDFYTTLVADDALITNAFVFTAVALVILFRTEDFLVKEAVLLGALGSIVDCLRLRYFAMAPRKDAFGRRDAEAKTVPSITRRKWFAGSECHIFKCLNV